MALLSQRKEVLDAARKLYDWGLNRGTSGNVSVRDDSGFLITASGVPWDALGLDHLVGLRLDGRRFHGGFAPSSEWQFHRDIYASRPEVGAIVHTHSMFCTTLSTLRRDLPAVHYMIAVAGTNLVRCAEYATFGTVELSQHALAALGGSKACLLANHGMISCGRDLDEALKIAREIELVAEQYWRALSVGTPHILSEAQMAEVHERFATYGRPKPLPRIAG